MSSARETAEVAMGRDEAAWCVEHRDGYCVCAVNRKPREGAPQVETKCGQFVILPFGFLKTAPDCDECSAMLEAVR